MEMWVVARRKRIVGDYDRVAVGPRVAHAARVDAPRGGHGASGNHSSRGRHGPGGGRQGLPRPCPPLPTHGRMTISAGAARTVQGESVLLAVGLLRRSE